MASQTRSRRTLRSSSSVPPSKVYNPVPEPPSQLRPITFHASVGSSAGNITLFFPSTARLPQATSTTHRLLRQKQHLLRTSSQPIPDENPAATAQAATYIFAQAAAGTAVCIHPSGILLTCAHCFGDTEEECGSHSGRAWLLSSAGDAVLARVTHWDGMRDVAVLRIEIVEASATGRVPVFASVKIADGMPKPGTRVVCVGQPGREDLESEKRKKTDYELIEVSYGKYRGIAKGADPQDNSEIGALMHDAWTYWGHSGAPLVAMNAGEKGCLIGLHSSWDDETGMRRGVPIQAIRAVLDESGQDWWEKGEGGKEDQEESLIYLGQRLPDRRKGDFLVIDD